MSIFFRFMASHGTRSKLIPFLHDDMDIVSYLKCFECDKMLELSTALSSVSCHQFSTGLSMATPPSLWRL